MIVNVPMQPIDSSYSKQWHEWIEQELTTRNRGTLGEYKYITIFPFSLKPDTGKGYTDTVSVIDWRAYQLHLICEAVNEGKIPKDKHVVFFFHNAWFPIDQLAFLRDMLGAHDWKFVGCFRDGTYDKWDMSARNNMYTWGEDIENGWLKIYDAVVVGSQFHKDTLVENRKIRENKIHVIPWHVEVPNMKNMLKDNIVVWPHRNDPEKQPDVFKRLAVDCRKDGWAFIKTRDITPPLNKYDYQNLLAKSKIVVSTALLEMFGNAMVEAALLGCIPLVPDRLSYKEMFTLPYRYRDYDDLVVKLKQLMKLKASPPVPYLYDKLSTRLRDKQFFSNLFQLIEEI